MCSPVQSLPLYRQGPWAELGRVYRENSGQQSPQHAAFSSLGTCRSHQGGREARALPEQSPLRRTGSKLLQQDKLQPLSTRWPSTPLGPRHLGWAFLSGPTGPCHSSHLTEPQAELSSQGHSLPMSLVPRDPLSSRV